MYLAD